MNWPLLRSKTLIQIGDCFLPTPESSGIPPFVAIHYEVVAICTEHRNCYLMVGVANDRHIGWQLVEWVRSGMKGKHTPIAYIRTQMQLTYEAFKFSDLILSRKTAIDRLIELEASMRKRTGPPPSILRLTQTELKEINEAYQLALGEPISLGGWDGEPYILDSRASQA